MTIFAVLSSAALSLSLLRIEPARPEFSAKDLKELSEVRQETTAVPWPDLIFEHKFQKEKVTIKVDSAQVERPLKAPVAVPVVLEGTVVDKIPERSAAVFRMRSGKQIVVTVKNALPIPDSEWFLELVAAEHVVISRGEQQETVQMLKNPGR